MFLAVCSRITCVPLSLRAAPRPCASPRNPSSALVEMMPVPSRSQGRSLAVVQNDAWCLRACRGAHSSRDCPAGLFLGVSVLSDAAPASCRPPQLPPRVLGGAARQHPARLSSPPTPAGRVGPAPRGAAPLAFSLSSCRRTQRPGARLTSHRLVSGTRVPPLLDGRRGQAQSGRRQTVGPGAWWRQVLPVGPGPLSSAQRQEERCGPHCRSGGGARLQDPGTPATRARALGHREQGQGCAPPGPERTGGREEDRRTGEERRKLGGW